MRKILFSILIALVLSAVATNAQDINPSSESVTVDSLVYRPADAMDASLAGKSIFSLLSGEGVVVEQDAGIVNAMSAHIAKNRKKTVSGYRVRIYFDNKQNSRGASEAAMMRFKGAFPGIPAYRSFTSPFFKVTVGDFRTKSEAAQLLQNLKGMFPNAFIIKEKINYPAVDRGHSFVVDTVKVPVTRR